MVSFLRKSKNVVPRTVASVMATFNKAIDDLKLIESQHETIVATNEALVVEATANAKASTEKKNEAAAVRAKLEALVSA